MHNPRKKVCSGRGKGPPLLELVDVPTVRMGVAPVTRQLLKFKMKDSIRNTLYYEIKL
jgi:hypothetical protein